MATEQIVPVASTTRPGARKASAFSRFLVKYFYFCMSLLIAAVVIYGFSHTVDQNLIHATPPRPWILWAHGIVFSGWLAFFIFQSALVRTHHVKVHKLTGWFGVVLGVLIPVLGILTAIIMHRFIFSHFHAAAVALPPNGANNTFFSIQTSDILLFTVFFWLAIVWRKKPEFHRRLVLVATIALTSAGFGRWPMISHHWFYAAVDALILLGIARDVIVTRRIHIVYRYALPAFVICQIFAVQIWLRQPAWWVHVTNAIILG
ncbi:MAG: hypothetical protein ACRD28_04355 [Acidobacteriaceae bacterium]